MTGMEKQLLLFPILLVNFTGTLGFSIVLPFLVFLVIDFGGNAIVFGILSAMYPTFQLVGAPILGRWSDIYGRKKILFISNIGTFVGWLLFLLALLLPISRLFDINFSLIGTFVITLPLVMLFIARAIDGITGGNVSVANAYLADISSNEDRSKNFGKMAISSNLGFIIGPALAGILGGTIYGEILPVLAAILISVVTLIVIPFTLKESKPLSSQMQVFERGTVRKVFAHECKDCYDSAENNKITFKDVLKLKHVPFLLSIYFLIFLGFNIFYTSFPIHAVTGLNWSVTQIGIFFVVLSGIMVAVQGPVLRKALTRFSEEKLVILGNMILGINFLLFISNNIILLYVAAVLFAIGNGLMWASFMSILSYRAGTIHQGTVQGFAGSFGSLASIIGLTIGGIMYSLFGSTTFLVSAIVIFAVSILSFRLLKMK
jgi:MFS transporter, DHA1 family, tetracycline resistance protein